MFVWQDELWTLAPGVEVEAVERVAEAVKRLTHAAPQNALIMALGEVGVLCKLKNMTPDELKGTLKTFAGRLQDHPADCVLKALKEWPNKHTFFPALGEIVAEIDKLSPLRARVTHGLARTIERLRAAA